MPLLRSEEYLENVEGVLREMFGMTFFPHHEPSCPECAAKNSAISSAIIPSRRLPRPFGVYMGDEFFFTHPIIGYTLLSCGRGHSWAVDLEIRLGTL